MSRGMACRTAVALALALALCTGCFIFDEIDQGREEMKRYSGRPGHRAAAEPEAPEEEEEGPGLIARVQQFFQEKTEGSGPERPADDEIITCDLQDGITFTYESDCLARGGTPH